MTVTLILRGIALLALSWACTFAIAQLAAPPTEEQLTAVGGVQVKGDELASLLKNQTLEHTNLRSGQLIPIFFRDDGRRFVGLGSSVRETKWWIKDDMRCEDSVAGRGSVCHKIFKQGDTYRICSVGEQQCNWIVTVTSGDTRKLAK
jgi:hypothetical protein